jgi:hypothetical protein
MRYKVEYEYTFDWYYDVGSEEELDKAISDNMEDMLMQEPNLEDFQSFLHEKDRYEVDKNGNRVGVRNE